MSIWFGNRRSLTNPELSNLENWLIDKESLETTKYIDSGIRQEKYLRKRIKESEKEIRALKDKYEPVQYGEVSLFDDDEDEDDAVNPYDDAEAAEADDEAYELYMEEEEKKSEEAFDKRMEEEEKLLEQEEE